MIYAHEKTRVKVMVKRYIIEAKVVVIEQVVVDANDEYTAHEMARREVKQLNPEGHIETIEMCDCYDPNDRDGEYE